MFSAFGLLGCIGSGCKVLAEFVFHVPRGLNIKPEYVLCKHQGISNKEMPTPAGISHFETAHLFFNGFLGYWDEGRKMGTKFCRCFTQAVALGAGSSRSKGASAPPWVADYSANTRLLGRYCTL